MDFLYNYNQNFPQTQAIFDIISNSRKTHIKGTYILCIIHVLCAFFVMHKNYPAESF